MLLEISIQLRNLYFNTGFEEEPVSLPSQEKRAVFSTWTSPFDE